jgi:hypothetical protein
VRARCLALALLLGGCGPEVTVGENSAEADGTPGGDSGLLAVRYDAASGALLAAGHHGCAEPSSVDCDVWLASVDEQAAVGSIDLFGSGLLDRANALWLLDADSALLAGVASSSGAPRALALRFDGDLLAWSSEELSLAAESEATAVEGAPDGTLLVAGNELGEAGLLDGFVARIDEDGSVLQQSSLLGTGAENTEIRGLVVDDLNHVFVAGVRRRGEGAALERLPVIVQLSDQLEVWNSNTELGLDVLSGKAVNLFLDGPDELVVCGSADDQAFVARIDGLLTMTESVFIADPVGAVDVRACAPTDDGGLVLVGAAGGAPWLAKVERSTLDVVFTRAAEPASASLWGVTGTSGGRALAVGRNEPSGRPLALLIEP